MADHDSGADTPRCVWMSAGLLTYKLCDRNFDCERCPLDAGLRGAPLLCSHRLLLSKPGRGLRVFPEDRRYTLGHVWVQELSGRPDGRARIGMDAFAAALIARATEIRWDLSGCTLRPGQAVCEIDLDLGVLSLGAPVRGRVRLGNHALDVSPGLAITSPYGEGWIAELAGVDSAELSGLLSSDEAREQTRLDLRRFRRQLALHLLAEGGGAIGPSLADGGEILTDLRQMLGGMRYMELLQQFVR